MQIKSITDRAEILFEQGELLIINAALNEICNGIYVREFETRIGASPSEVGRLLYSIQAVLDALEKK